MKKQHTIALQHKLAELGVKTTSLQNNLVFSKGNISQTFIVSDEQTEVLYDGEKTIIPLDVLITHPNKIVAIILSKLKLNKSIYARSCQLKKVDKSTAAQFLEQYHLIGATQSATNLGLYYNETLVALASFSKGRKMNRLNEDQRSFELIRFCCMSGITVTGGLTRLVKNFCAEKKAGDIMTYIDKQLSDGRSFLNAGFKKHSETEPNYFLVDRTTFQRKPTDKNQTYDKQKFYLTKNSGNIKLIYTPS